MHVIPEIGEEVIVSFENGNAEKPVVIGAMFNGEGKSGHGGAGNYIKGLQSASGNNLSLNDQVGSASLTDSVGSTITLNGDGTITISSATKIEINSETIELNGKYINLTAQEEINGVSGKTATVYAKEKATLSSDDATVVSGKVTAAVTSKDVSIDGSATTSVSGNSKTTISATGKTEVSGAIVKLN